MALTFDTCGGPGGDGYDERLIDVLLSAEVPATLFVNRRWIEANEQRFARLADEPLFEIANHGTRHRPLSVSGRGAYGISGTEDPQAVIDEVVDCQRAIWHRTGETPRHFRPGTAHADEVAVRIVADLGLETVGYEVLGDAGATFSAAQVADAVGGAGEGSIVLLHMNHPSSGTADGVARAVPELRAAGMSFARIGEYDLR